MRTLALLAALLALAACGRVGPVRAPGPPSKIVYPRSYPYIPPVAIPPAAAPAADAASPGLGGGSPVPADNAAQESGVGSVTRPASPR